MPRAPRPRGARSRSRSRNLTIVVRQRSSGSSGESLMGQKVNPIGLRLGINRTWDFRWFADKNEYGKLLHEDIKIREVLMKQLKQAGVSKIIIERPHKKCRVTIHTARPGVVIGKKGADIEKLRKKVAEDAPTAKCISTSSRCASPRSTRTLVAEDDRPAARAPRRVPPRHEARGAVGDAPRRARASASTARAVSAAPKSRAWNGTAKAACRCTRCAPTSTTASRTAHHLRHQRRQGVDLQRRDPGARSDGAGQAHGRGRQSGRPRRDAANAAGLRIRERTIMLQPKRTKFRKAFKGRIHGKAKGGADAQLRPVRPEGAGARARHRAPDRSGAPRDHPRDEARRAASGSASSRTCRCRRSRPKSAWARARARRNSGPRA